MAAKAMSPCLDDGNESDIEGRIHDHTDTMEALIAGDAVIECGNGVADGDDQCDGSDLGGETCAGLDFTPGGTLACTTGCGFDTSGCETEHIAASGQTTSAEPGMTVPFSRGQPCPSVITATVRSRTSIPD